MYDEKYLLVGEMRRAGMRDPEKLFISSPESRLLCAAHLGGVKAVSLAMEWTYGCKEKRRGERESQEIMRGHMHACSIGMPSQAALITSDLIPGSRLPPDG